jgi:hypothetical protein
MQAGAVSEEAGKLHGLISKAKNKVGSCYRLSGEAAMINLFQSLSGSTTLSDWELKEATRLGDLFDRWARAALLAIAAVPRYWAVSPLAYREAGYWRHPQGGSVPSRRRRSSALGTVGGQAVAW